MAPAQEIATAVATAVAHAMQNNAPAPPAPPAVAFARAPALVNNNIIDYSSAAGAKILKYVCSKDCVELASAEIQHGTL